MISLSPDGGSWQTFTRIFEKDNPCLGRKYRIQIVERMDIAVAVKVFASEVVPGCEDHTITLIKIDANTLEGQLGSGGAIRLTRK
ncbi:hypothetical protein QTI24_29545 [Variovorax sp. J22P240]|uniref:hypothetical protein n=1 Tax=Variovorax sp. J22P240 TaxID=3053514 RepID=UPI0025774C97|nr:hypothetical protein [Variovorax sp. J22P240]MDM0002772.1 hypothetical protein [Variovorax sp. J22P240]